MDGGSILSDWLCLLFQNVFLITKLSEFFGHSNICDWWSQRGTPWSDGAAGLSESGIPRGRTRLYNFTVDRVSTRPSSYYSFLLIVAWAFWDVYFFVISGLFAEVHKLVSHKHHILLIAIIHACLWLLRAFQDDNHTTLNSEICYFIAGGHLLLAWAFRSSKSGRFVRPPHSGRANWSRHTKLWWNLRGQSSGLVEQCGHLRSSPRITNLQQLEMGRQSKLPSDQRSLISLSRPLILPRRRASLRYQTTPTSGFFDGGNGGRNTHLECPPGEDLPRPNSKRNLNLVPELSDPGSWTDDDRSWWTLDTEF